MFGLGLSSSRAIKVELKRGSLDIYKAQAQLDLARLQMNELELELEFENTNKLSCEQSKKKSANLENQIKHPNATIN